MWLPASFLKMPKWLCLYIHILAVKLEPGLKACHFLSMHWWLLRSLCIWGEGTHYRDGGCEKFLDIAQKRMLINWINIAVFIMGKENKGSDVQAFILPSTVTLGKALDLLQPQFPHFLKPYLKQCVDRDNACKTILRIVRSISILFGFCWIDVCFKQFCVYSIVDLVIIQLFISEAGIG